MPLAASVSGGVMVPLVTALVDSLGWRNAMTILGAGMFVIVLPLALIVKSRPEDYGMLPDGDVISRVNRAKTGKPNIADEYEVSTKTALMSRAFWQITLALAIQHLATNAVSTHIMPYLSSVGVSRAIGSLVATVLPIASMGGRFGFGWAGDMVKKKPHIGFRQSNNIRRLITGFLGGFGIYINIFIKIINLFF